MKGYGILTCILFCVLIILPVTMLVPNHKTEVSVPSKVLVRYTDSEETEQIDLYDMTYYETIAKMPSDAPDEAIKAQFIADYTVLYYQHVTSGIVTATTLLYPQSYTTEYWKTVWGEQYIAYNQRFRTLLDEVYGTYIMYDGQPIMAVSHSMNNGQTENAVNVWEMDIPYLRSVASPSDVLCSDQTTIIPMTKTDVSSRLQPLIQQVPDGDLTSWFGDIKKTNIGTVLTVEIGGGIVDGQQLANALGLPSAVFDIAVQGDQIQFTVYGKGHYVGLSVSGAIAMANDGQTHTSILKHYYSDVTIK